MNEILFVVIATAVALAGVFVGAQVQKICKFIFPTDFITIGILVGIIASICIPTIYINEIWFGSFLVGYLVGYLIVGRTTYTLAMRITSPKAYKIEPLVLYEFDGQMYIQEQTNRALINRVVFGYSHAIECDFPIDDDSMLSYKRPLFPLFEDRMILIENMYAYQPTIHKGLIFKHKEYTTHIDVAYGTLESKMNLMYDFDLMDEMQHQIIDLTNKIHKLQSETGPKMLENALMLDSLAKQTTAENRMLNLVKYMSKKEKIPVKEKEKQTENGGEKDGSNTQTTDSI